MTQAKLISSVLGILYYLHQFFSPSVARHLKGPCLPLYTVCMTLSECARCVLLCMIVYNITQTVHGNFTGTLSQISVCLNGCGLTFVGKFTYLSHAINIKRTDPDDKKADHQTCCHG